MGESTPHKWGLFDPLSTTLPTERELAQNDAMIEELKRNNNFEAPSETQKRSEVLKTFQRCFTDFVKFVGRKKGMSDAQLQDAGGKVATFGSFRLGAYGPGSDIDTLVIAPKHVLREDFFEHFLEILEKASTPGAIEDVKKVPDAHVPLIKMEYLGISIDMIFARLQLASVPLSLDMKNNDLLKGLDDVESRCINGTRVSDLLVSLVPQEKTFRHTLRTIKLWAQRRGIYGNVFGFPGGIAWAIMVASVCQYYPQACGSVLVGKFFSIISGWSWPRPIMLKSIDDAPPGVQQKVWNPVLYRADKGHLMPIITPAYPSMCATHNITQSTKLVIRDELKRGGEITTDILNGHKQWSDLFAKHTFFTKDYKHYLCIVSGSKTKEAQAIWSGLIESKVRKLVAGVEESQPSIDLARPFVKGYARVHQANSQDEIDRILAGKLDYMITDSTAEKSDAATDAAHQAAAQENNENMKMPAADNDGDKAAENGKFPRTIYTTTYYIGIVLASGSKSLDVSYPVQDFVRQCEGWSQFDQELNSVRVMHVRSHDLPDDVFEPGESRPAKKNKGTTNSSAKNQSDKKRSFADADVDGASLPSAKRHQSSAAAA